MVSFLSPSSANTLPNTESQMIFKTIGTFLVLVCSMTVGVADANSATDKPKTIVWQGTVPVAATFTVPKGTTLEIRPGSRIVFAPGTSLMVQGELKAIGEKGREIVFTTVKQKTPGSWHEIMFEEAGESRMEHCVIEFAGWGVHSHDTRLSVVACTFRNNEGGLRFRGGPLSIRQSLFTDNGIGLRSYQGEGTISECDFSGNGTGIFVREKGSGLTVTRSNFTRNSVYNIRLGDFNDEDVQAPGNWWGQADPTSTLFDDRNEPGIGRIYFEPYSRERLPL